MLKSLIELITPTTLLAAFLLLILGIQDHKINKLEDDLQHCQNTKNECLINYNIQSQLLEEYMLNEESLKADYETSMKALNQEYKEYKEQLRGKNLTCEEKLKEIEKAQHTFFNR